jgi:hypothetical protein
MFSNGEMRLVNRNMEQSKYENRKRSVTNANIPINGIHP